MNHAEVLELKMMIRMLLTGYSEDVIVNHMLNRWEQEQRAVKRVSNKGR